jgi:mRNA interferase MazF
VKRGEIWTAAGGAAYAGKPRPVVIVQDDRFDATASITVCGLTTTELDAPLARPRIEPSASNGLRSASHIMVDKIATVPKHRIDQRIGALSDEDIVRLNRAMVVFLGLAG